MLKSQTSSCTVAVASIRVIFNNTPKNASRIREGLSLFIIYGFDAAANEMMEVGMKGGRVDGTGVPSVGDVGRRLAAPGLAGDVRAVPAGRPLGHEALGLGRALGHVAVVAVVLDHAVELEGRLLGEGVVPCVGELVGRGAEGGGVLLAARGDARPAAVDAAAPLREPDHVVSRVAAVVGPVAEEPAAHRQEAALDLHELRTLAVGLDAGHAAGPVAPALLLLALAVLVGRALPQALLPEDLGLLLVPGTLGRGRVARVLVDPALVVDLRLRGIIVLLAVLLVPLVVLVLLLLLLDGRLPLELRLRAGDEGAHEEEAQEGQGGARPHPRRFARGTAAGTAHPPVSSGYGAEDGSIGGSMTGGARLGPRSTCSRGSWTGRRPGPRR
jgi:hypothetical protein